MEAQAVPSDLPNGGVEAGTGCARCGATTHLDDGTCLNCLLKEGLEAHGEASSKVFESVLSEADVPDTHWRLGNYEILEEIGRGGMGVIYRAQQRHSRRIVAVKRVIAYQSDSHETLVRFQREAEAAASLDHPNILPIYEVSESEDGLPFFSMKYATGGNLRAAIPALQTKPNECVRLMAKVVRAIAYAHDHGILHRDLQPGNILLDGNGEPMVSDFGLAKWLDENSDLTRTLTTFGTPGYIAPEQAEDAAGNITPAADIYSLGAILFHLLAGRPPFVGANVLSVIHQAAATPAPRLRSLTPSLDRDLETILVRSLERDPKARYQTAGALAEDLERWLEGRPILARPVHAPTRIWRWARRNPVLSGTATACLALTAVVVWLLRGQFVNTPELPPPEKSIAVLPFENLSDNKENADFAAGIQDDLLTRLAQIHDLKVISRTSVMQYKSEAPRNVREIGKQLGVERVLEGSVQCVGNRVRVNAQLIDARTDAHLWAQTYDRALADFFNIQSEIAEQIVAQLQAKLSPSEKAGIEKPATTDLMAYGLYQRARTLYADTTNNVHAMEILPQVARLLDQAVARDDHFLLAWCLLSKVHGEIYFFGHDRTPARLEMAKAAVRGALQYYPEAGETHLALAYYYYHGFRDFARAREELAIARRTLPNNAEVYEYTSYASCREGRWEEATQSMERAVELDPRNFLYLQQLALTYQLRCRYAQAERSWDRALAIVPGDPSTRLSRAQVALDWRADINPYKTTMATLIAENPSAAPDLDDPFYSVCERTAAAADQLLADYPRDGVAYHGVNYPHAYWEGVVARGQNDSAKAQAAFAAARGEVAKTVEKQPDFAQALSLLGMIDAGLGRKEEALREGRRACELLPISRDALSGTGLAANLAQIYAWVDEKNLAIEQLATVERVPNYLSYGLLKLQPQWDPLRGDPRFEELVESFAPEVKNAGISAVAAPEKSIAVLPFQDLSDNKENSEFAAGIQDDLLTSLAQIHELKVISRTSVMAYQKPDGRNVRAIGRELDVENILEGSVRRAGDHVLVNVQLIDARNDRHLWAERYDRTVADSIGLQGELATQIATALKAQLAPEEKASIETKPTDNPEAYALYLQARGREGSGKNAPDDDVITEQLYARAIALDPNFALAHARRSILKSRLAIETDAPARRAEARTEAEAALRLSPSLAEAHTALGLSLYWGGKNYAAALKEFSIAAAISPNEPDLLGYVAGLYRRQGRWRESLATFERARDLDPRNREILLLAGNSHLFVRDWTGASACFNRELKIAPDAVVARIGLAYLEVFQHNNPAAGRNILRSIPTGVDPGGMVAETRWDLAMLERDYAGAEKILADFSLKNFPVVGAPKTFFQGRTALARGDVESAQRYFAAARPDIEEMVRENPSDPDKHVTLALLYSYMQRKEDALREARRAVELEPESQNAFHGTLHSANLALVDALVGEQDQAITLIERLLSTPGPIHWPDHPMSMTLADLRLRWEWDSLRSNPRFQKILARPEPKTVY